MQYGCPTTVKIPTTDPDGDSVTCRFGQTDEECGEACTSFPYFTLGFGGVSYCDRQAI